MNLSIFILLLMYAKTITSYRCHVDLITTITGRFMCKGIPDNNVQILIGRKTFFGIISYFHMQKPCYYGNIKIIFNRRKYLNIKPVMKIIHRCKVLRNNCHIEAIKQIPPVYFSGRGIPTNVTFNFGTLDLIRYLPNQKFICRRAK
ncbi:Hypothetical protein SRAE_2000460800 [Strongyloides ratti]|uniref:Transthyretin-like family-containing protein n=1 Tax=Strongyloides ratti TaxID=34506 RepID=A0A090LJF1_STRRB|nr:Hypothetical protein SRAE_2000460800 [Strongyloides ratti]CEF69962.2 Hypothetical protein SRAE_2000460800 [Strongyloides ratti]